MAFAARSFVAFCLLCLLLCGRSCLQGTRKGAATAEQKASMPPTGSRVVFLMCRRSCLQGVQKKGAAKGCTRPRTKQNNSSGGWPHVYTIPSVRPRKKKPRVPNIYFQVYRDPSYVSLTSRAAFPLRTQHANTYLCMAIFVN